MQIRAAVPVLLLLGVTTLPPAPALAQIEVIPESELSPGAKFAVAIEDDDLDKVRALLDSGLAADTPIDYGENAETPLMKAAREGTLGIARLLIARGANVNAQDGEKSTALEAAISREQTEMVALLLEAKADPNSVNTYMQSALSNAAAAGNLAVTEMLLKAKAKPELPGLVLTPMMFGAFAGNGDLIRLLVRYGADVNYATKEYGQSALTSAITAGKPDMVALLIELKANVNQKTPDGDTPLKMAKNGDQDDVVAMLKAAGAKE
ncbi:MAG: ankyrin repeat domain-containing protein [Thermoanaerobaculia bacterium]